jgi:hypothetical protein
MAETQDEGQPKAGKTLLRRLMGALQDMEQPKKDTQGYGYQYATLDQVVGIVTKACRAHDLMWRQGVVKDEDGFVLVTSVTDGAGEAVMDVRPFPRLPKPQDQGSAETYTRRYALLTAFGLAPEDDDGQAAQESQPAPAKTHKTVAEQLALTAAHIGKTEGAVRLAAEDRTGGAALEEADPDSVRRILRQIYTGAIEVTEV